MIATRSIPERTDEFAWVLAALYGANQLARLGQAFAETRQQKLFGADQADAQRHYQVAPWVSYRSLGVSSPWRKGHISQLLWEMLRSNCESYKPSPWAEIL